MSLFESVLVVEELLLLEYKEVSVTGILFSLYVLFSSLKNKKPILIQVREKDNSEAEISQSSFEQ